MAAREILKSNDCWRAAFCGQTGTILGLQDLRTGRELVRRPDEDPEEIGEGGFVARRGLELWIKSGESLDYNTGVLSTFAAIHAAPHAIAENGDGLAVTAGHDGCRLEITYVLPPGVAPLKVKARLENRQGRAETFQFECFYQWSIPGTEWVQTIYLLPGMKPARLFPFGELYFRAGDGAVLPAAWWLPGTRGGVVLRALKGVDKYFVGVQAPGFILGPHGRRRKLERGEAEEMEFEIIPLNLAIDRRWFAGREAAEDSIRRQNAERKEVTLRVGGVSGWCQRKTPAIPRRMIHLTTQYSAVDTDDVLQLVENVIVPAGFNEIVFEVGRNFRYVSHPKVCPSWGWDAMRWKGLVRRIRGLGLAVVPQYNALAHQGESGLAKAYPELAEDPEGWCLNPEHPLTEKYLGDIFGELIDVFEPRIFHVGLDEIDVPSRPQTFALPKAGRRRGGGELFALHVNNLYGLVKQRGLEMMMWADMLFYKPEHQTPNGARTGTWRAIDAIPRDILMVDWVYHPVPDFGGSRYLAQNGFRVIGATWHTPRNIRDWAAFAARQALAGMMHTTWAIPRMNNINMVCTLLAGKYFQDPSAPPLETAVPEAEALALALMP